MSGRKLFARWLRTVEPVVLTVGARGLVGEGDGYPLETRSPGASHGQGPERKGGHDVIPSQPLDPLALPLAEGRADMFGDDRLLG